jgi:hypothetical protein
VRNEATKQPTNNATWHVLLILFLHILFPTIIVCVVRNLDPDVVHGHLHVLNEGERGEREGGQRGERGGREGGQRGEMTREGQKGARERDREHAREQESQGKRHAREQGSGGERGGRKVRCERGWGGDLRGH